jgi:hypothetical protein
MYKWSAYKQHVHSMCRYGCDVGLPYPTTSSYECSRCLPLLIIERSNDILVSRSCRAMGCSHGSGRGLRWWLYVHGFADVSVEESHESR